MQEYVAVLRKYAQFTGRSSRREYWLFVLVDVFILLVLAMWDSILFRHADVAPLSALYSLGVILPSFAATVRRLQDTGRSGHWFWIQLVPIAGSLVLIVLLVQAGQSGPNRFGPDPIRESAACDEDPERVLPAQGVPAAWYADAKPPDTRQEGL